MPPRLSYSKFLSMLNKHGYITSTVYYTKSGERHRKVEFFECRLPKTQKNILIRVPDRYSMVLPENINFKTIEIVKLGSNTGLLTERSVSYLLQVRGPLLESDLVVISSEGLCYSKFNGETICYFFSSNMPKIENKETIEDLNSEDDEIGKLEKELNETSFKLKKQGIKIPHKTKILDIPDTDVNPSDKKENPSDKKENPSDKKESPLSEDVDTEDDEEIFVDDDEENPESVELVFEEDSEEEFIDSDDEEIVDSDDEEIVDSDDEEIVDSDDEDVIAEGKKLRNFESSNHITIDELDVNLGVIYVVIDVNILHSKFSIYEIEALGVYEQIEDNEKEMIDDRVSEIKKQLDLASKHLELRIKEIFLDERSMKYQLLRLTGILQDAENMKIKTSSKKSNMITDPIIVEIDRVYNKTKKTVHELNVSILRQRDEIEDLLINYEESLKELFEL